MKFFKKWRDLVKRPGNVLLFNCFEYKQVFRTTWVSEKCL